jgi:hypothetical protein
MKRTLLIVLCAALFWLPSPVFAGSYDLEDLADRLARQARDFADDAERDYQYRSRPDRSQVERLYQSRMFLTGVELFNQMVHDRRRNSELRDAFAVLRSQPRSADWKWRDIEQTLKDLDNLFGTSAAPPITPPPRAVAGRLIWRGTVDGEILLSVRAGQVSIQNLSGAPVSNQQFNFTSPLPRTPVSVEIARKSGRGRVEVIQQPTAANDFTAVVRIRDRDGGARNYEFEMIW